ncbi:hypothetical protein [Chondromyces crocatus]|uniref:Uncharacterized protein n=1 Tax=Chondromyces crocatus TaxID=52 RepID=A0A0K1EBK4_CHOCO|nr:hypothetical protein [Chondromyces crocatus]AKT38245.1 uncharacterized protein CMC5_023880 [Chondromyces crocatus]
MPKLNWIDALFFGVRRILAGGVEMPERPAINFVGATVTDNPAENRIDVVLGGSGLRKISPIVTSDYTASPGELVRVDGHRAIVITLPPAAPNALATVVVKKVNGGDGDITIAAPPGQAVGGQISIHTLAAHGRAEFMSDALSWLIL